MTEIEEHLIQRAMASGLVTREECVHRMQQVLIACCQRGFTYVQYLKALDPVGYLEALEASALAPVSEWVKEGEHRAYQDQ